MFHVRERKPRSPLLGAENTLFHIYKGNVWVMNYVCSHPQLSQSTREHAHNLVHQLNTGALTVINNRQTVTLDCLMTWIEADTGDHSSPWGISHFALLTDRGNNVFAFSGHIEYGFSFIFFQPMMAMTVDAICADWAARTHGHYSKQIANGKM